MQGKHLKKGLCLLLALALFLPLMAAAERFDLSKIREEPKIFTIDVDAEKDVAFIESTLSVKERSFVHEFESGVRYSSTMFDMLVHNYFETDSYPVFRLWISYCADDFLYINSVTFELNGVKYTFSGVSDSEWRTTYDDGGIMEKMLIKFDMENLDFLVALDEAAETVDNEIARMDELNITLTLHGTKDVTVKLGKGFWTDFLLLEAGMSNSGGLTVENMKKVNGTDLWVH